MVLSLGPALARKLPAVATGASLQIVTESTPSLAGAKTAIGGGPVLVRNGRRQKIVPPPGESYEFTSMLERHPRSAIGWNRDFFFLVEVDGRQPDLSVGMTLDELGNFLVGLGCRDAMNLDGGGSATLWYDGKVRNSPCDRRERPIANSLLVVSKGRAGPAAMSQAGSEPAR
jgi:exopolysaccharide biosynthesis protein